MKMKAKYSLSLLVASAALPTSFTRQTSEGMALTLELRVDAGPERPVTLAVGNAKIGDDPRGRFRAVDFQRRAAIHRRSDHVGAR